MVVNDTLTARTCQHRVDATAVLVERLPQTLQQLESFLQRQLCDGRIAVDEGTQFQGQNAFAAIQTATKALLKLKGAVPAAEQLKWPEPTCPNPAK